MTRILALVAFLLIAPAGAASAGATSAEATNTCPIYMDYHGHQPARVVHNLRHPVRHPPHHHRRR
jgi:hypothetical protein